MPSSGFVEVFVSAAHMQSAKPVPLDEKEKEGAHILNHEEYANFRGCVGKRSDFTVNRLSHMLRSPCTVDEMRMMRVTRDPRGRSNRVQWLRLQSGESSRGLSVYSESDWRRDGQPLSGWRNGGRRQGRGGEGGMFVHAGANRVSIVAQSPWRCRVCVRGSNCKAGPVPPSRTHGSGRAIRDSDSVGGFHVGIRSGLTTEGYNVSVKWTSPWDRERCRQRQLGTGVALKCGGHGRCARGTLLAQQGLMNMATGAEGVELKEFH